MATRVKSFLAQQREEQLRAEAKRAEYLKSPLQTNKGDRTDRR